MIYPDSFSIRTKPFFPFLTVFFLRVALLIIILFSQQKTQSHAAVNIVAQPIGLSGKWKLVFDDEFNGTSLDTTKWSTGWFGNGITRGANVKEQECNDPAQVTIANGELNIVAIARQETCGGVTYPYTSGMITSKGKYQFTYGYIEARIWLSAASNGSIANWPAFWTDGQNDEMDVLEGLGGRPCWHFHDPDGRPGSCASGKWTRGWHTFGADWQPGSVTYYYDGQKVGQIASGITSSPMHLILSYAISSRYGGQTVVPATMKVHYVRVWQLCSRHRTKNKSDQNTPTVCQSSRKYH